MEITEKLWNMALNLLQDLNPEVAMSELEAIARRGFAMCINPCDYINNLLGV